MSKKVFAAKKKESERERERSQWNVSDKELGRKAPPKLNFQRCAKGIDGSSNSSRSLLMRISGIRGTGACAAAEV